MEDSIKSAEIESNGLPAVPVDTSHPDGGRAAGMDAYKEISLEQLASVHAVLSPDRAAVAHDILITTALEALRDGPMTESALVDYARRIWPGTGIDAARMNASMRVASTARYVVAVEEADEPRWALSQIGTSEVAGSRNWARDIFESTARQVEEQLRLAGRDVSTDEAQAWTTVLQQALMAGIRGSFAPYVGDVQPNGEIVTVRRWDEVAIRGVISRATANASDAELMVGLAIDAFDPLTNFGGELVTSITVGYMLHAFIGRRDRVAQRGVVGSLNGDRALLDTPILLRLLGSAEISRSIERVISAAIGAGMMVIALRHYLEELNELIASVEVDQLPLIQQALETGVDIGTVGRLVEDDVVSLWLRAMQSGRYSDWNGFRQAGSDLGSTLGRLGVVVRDHNNRDVAIVVRCEKAIGDELARHGRTRRKAALERDAHTMVMARRKRDRTEGFWPGAWIITTDIRIGPAYREMFPTDPFSLTLTPASWVSIVSNFTPPAEVETLAEAAGQLFSEEAFMTIAARFPVRTAIELARALGPSSGGSPLDVRVAQGIDQLLRAQPDYDEADNALGARIAAEVVSRRAQRMNQSFAAGTAQMALREERMATALTQTQRRADAGDAERATLEAERDGARAEASVAKQLSADTKVLEHRRTISILLGVGLLAVVFALAYLQLWVGSLVAFFALLVFLRQASEWVGHRNSSWHVLLYAAAVDVLAVVLGAILK